MAEQRDIIIELNRKQFQELLRVNPGYVIIKFTATWCKPCKKIKPLVEQWFASLPKEFQCVELDVDDNDDMYAYMRAQRMVNGIPVLLGYKKGNYTIAPNYSVTGSNVAEVKRFFENCVKDTRFPQGENELNKK